MKRRTVVITRPREQSEELRRELEACGFQILFFPTIQIAPPASWEACDRALRRPPDHYDGFIFASGNGAKGFLRRMSELGLEPARYSKSAIYAVGPRTAEELEAGGFKVSYIPEDHNADALARHLASTDIRGNRFLFPRGNLGREELANRLSQAGAEVEIVEVYQTIAADMEGAGSLLRRIFQGEIDVVAFASPSAVKNFAGVIPGGGLEELSARTTMAAIGPSTLKMIRTLGGTGAVVAKTSTAGGLAKAIRAHFGDHE